VLKKPRLLLVYAMTTLGYGGTFIAFTYLAPILQDVAGFRAGQVGLVMLVYGVSVAAGISGAASWPTARVRCARCRSCSRCWPPCCWC
jgi:predicted MFS family arabinose efflux permease